MASHLMTFDPDTLRFSVDCRKKSPPKIFDRFTTAIMGDPAEFIVRTVTSHHPPRVTPWGDLSTHTFEACRVPPGFKIVTVETAVDTPTHRVG